jgi:cytidine deaminase
MAARLARAAARLERRHVSNKVIDEFLAGWNGDIRSQLECRLNERGVLPAELVAASISSRAITVDELMLLLIPVAATWARTPVSGYAVGSVAAGQTDNRYGCGCLYLGANFEFAGIGLNHSIHSEQSAINNAWLHDETGITAIAVSAEPCGHCRQFMQELAATDNALRILMPPGSDCFESPPRSCLLSDLYPQPFGPQHLGRQGQLLRQQRHCLDVSADDPLADRAVVAASMSYAPYTGNAAGVAVQTVDDRIVTGRYAENVAFNPSLSPAASALSQFSMTSPPQSPLQIQEVVLVEAASAISQYEATVSLLSSVAPSAPVRHLIAVERDQSTAAGA